MKEIRWSKIKSKRLKKVRGASFEELITAEVVAVWKHPNRESQHIMFVNYKGYIWMIPYVEEVDHIFLKTLYPSRKYTKMYKRGEFK